MSVRTWMAGAAVALVAVLGLAVVAAGSAAPAKKGATPLKVAVITDIGGLNDKGFNALAYNGLKVAQRQYGVQGRVFTSKSAADYIPNLSTAASQGYDLVIARRLPDGRLDRRRRQEVPEDEVRDHRRPRRRPKGKPKNVRGITFAAQEAGCLAGVAAATESKSGTISSVGGLKIPARRRVHRRLPVLRQEGQPGHQDAQRLLAGLRRSGQVQGNRPEPDRPGLGRRLPGRRRVRPRRHHGRQGLEGAGASASTTTRASSARTSSRARRRRSMRASRRRSS